MNGLMRIPSRKRLEAENKKERKRQIPPYLNGATDVESTT
jgi:hypothetical protein